MPLSRKPLKGMRQLPPPAKRVEDYITDRLRNAGRVYGFEEYEAPVLELLDLFLAKSGNELAVEQSYNFTDKGGRELIMRPELTPSLARMVAASGELINPVRWMSFPVCYRYERPQRGRVREFMQFNLDILGVEDLSAELDVFLVLRRIMRDLGAFEDSYVIRYSSRRLASAALSGLGFSGDELAVAYTVIDKQDKLPAEAWREWAAQEIADPEKLRSLIALASCRDINDPWLVETVGESEAWRELAEFSRMLEDAGVTEAVFEASVVRGLDYYTGIVFEVMDTGGENRRAICGGGRYDNLVSMFGGQPVSGVGFGLGLLTLSLFLKTYGLIPKDVENRHPADIFIAVFSPQERGYALKLAEDLRSRGIAVEMDITGKKVSRQLSIAGKKGIRYSTVIGSREIEEGGFQLKRMSSGEQFSCTAEEAAAIIGSGD